MCINSFIPSTTSGTVSVADIPVTGVWLSYASSLPTNAPSPQDPSVGDPITELPDTVNAVPFQNKVPPTL